jgi:hypothetical protein
MVKVDGQPTAWEFYITERIHQQISSIVADFLLKVDITDSFARIDDFSMYRDGCMSTMSYYKNGTLLVISFIYYFVLP